MALAIESNDENSPGPGARWGLSTWHRRSGFRTGVARILSRPSQTSEQPHRVSGKEWREFLPSLGVDRSYSASVNMEVHDD